MNKIKKGTSIVELLAVIVIMGIIAAIAVPTVGGLLTSTRKKAVGQDITSLVGSINNYRQMSAINENITYTLDGSTCAEDSNLGYFLYNETDKNEAAANCVSLTVTYLDGAVSVSGIYTKDSRYYKFENAKQDNNYKPANEYKTLAEAQN